MFENLPEFIYVSIAIVVTVFANMKILGETNVTMEMLKIRMKRIKIPPKLMPFIDQMGERVKPFPDDFKYEIYILIVILTIVTYIYEILTVTVTIIVYILVPEIILYMFFVPAVYSILLATVLQIYKVKMDRKKHKNFMSLDNDFTISTKKETNEKENADKEN